MVRRAVGDAAKLGGIEPIEPASVWPLVKSCILWNEEAGGAGPSEEIIKSQALASAVDRLERCIRDLVQTATTIESFWLEEGHPGYPVFWDFALLFRRDASATVFIGASSD